LSFTKQASGGVWGGHSPPGHDEGGHPSILFFSFFPFKKACFVFFSSLFSIQNKKACFGKPALIFFFLSLVPAVPCETVALDKH
jgi:hypothetical protein